MPVLETAVDPRAQAFQANRSAMLALIEEFRGLEARVRANSQKSRPRFAARNQLLPRERLELLLDRGTPFVELSTLAGYKTYDDDGDANISGGRIITGIGFVAGVRAMLYVSDSGIKAGAYHVMGLQKSLRAQEIALEQKLPLLQLVESGGADLLDYVPETFVRGGGMFYNMARLSAAGVPVITLVHGSSTAGGAYMPGMSDYTIMVRGRAKAFLAGPPLVKAAIGEVATDEELGGTDMHATVSGLTEYVADTDAEAIALLRDVVGRLGWNRHLAPAPATTFRDPRHDIDELCGIVPIDYRRPYDVREVIARLVDDSDYLEFKALLDPHTICGHAAIHGHVVGILGNNGPITADGAAKAGQFIQLCDQAGTPLVFLQNTTGYIVGTDPERRGIIKHGAKMIQAVSNARVPKLTLMLGGSFGAGNYGMCGRAYEPRFLLGWPNYRIAVMGAEQAAMVMQIVHTAAAERRGQPLTEAQREAMRGRVIELYESQSSALYATARLWDDGLIDPRDSRRVLGFLLDTCHEAARRTLHPNSFGVARF
ncbi:MAG: acyl-CoA carboxylase subunit beta [Alphaproteobacteria bacterium]|nr:acyl-CoA carboxylase subunit beta [Alphaproteobacteria bacterium]